MSSPSKIPLVSMEGNFGMLLSRIWPIPVTSRLRKSCRSLLPDAIRLLQVGSMDRNELRVAQGLCGCKAAPDATIHSSPLWVSADQEYCTAHCLGVALYMADRISAYGHDAGQWLLLRAATGTGLHG